MKTSLTTEENKFRNIFDNYVNGNFSDFRIQVRKLSKIDLLRCVDFVTRFYDSETYESKDILRIFLYYLQIND